MQAFTNASASKYKPNERKNTRPITDGKKRPLILGVSIVANILILSSAAALFFLSTSCVTSGMRNSSDPYTSYSRPRPNVNHTLSEYDTITNPNHQCGIPNTQPDLKRGRIVGGAEAVPYSWPFTVGVGTARVVEGNRISLSQMCGGTLISPRHALTAAHCFKSDPRTNQAKAYTVFTGVHSTATYKGFYPMQVAVLRFHPKTNALTEDQLLIYDFALLTLFKEFAPTTNIQIACLPTIRKVLPEGTLCWATGWGKTEGTGGENVLKQVVVDIVSEQKCQWEFNSGINMKSALCGGTTSGQDTCQGDSGGPLFHQENGKWLLYGVTSFGPTVCGAGPMAAYAAVSFNLEWICCFMANIPSCAGIRCVPSGEN